MADQVVVQEWQPFFMTLAGASAALAGHLFVAMSLHPWPILSHPVMRARAFAAAFGFLLGVAWALIMLLPARMAPIGSILLTAAGVGRACSSAPGGSGCATPACMWRSWSSRICSSRLRCWQAWSGCSSPVPPSPFLLLAIMAGLGLFLLFFQPLVGSVLGMGRWSACSCGPFVTSL